MLLRALSHTIRSFTSQPCHTIVNWIQSLITPAWQRIKIAHATPNSKRHFPLNLPRFFSRSSFILSRIVHTHVHAPHNFARSFVCRRHAKSAWAGVWPSPVLRRWLPSRCICIFSACTWQSSGGGSFAICENIMHFILRFSFFVNSIILMG